MNSMIGDAFKFMWYDKAKLVGILSGIIISVFLIGQQLGIFLSMAGNMKGLAKNHTEYIWVLHNNTKSSMQLLAMDVRIGRELYSVPSVVSVSPLVVAGGTAKFSNNNKVSVQLIGVDGPEYTGFPALLLQGAKPSMLESEGAVFADISDRESMAKIKPGDYFTVNDKRVYMAGFTTGNSGFGSSYLVTSIDRARYLSGMDNNQCNVYLVMCDTLKASKQQVIQYINSNIPHVRAWEGKAFGDSSYSYMMRTSNIAMSFGLMVVFALVAGFTIVGLTLYSSVNDRLRDYGTIKAIGGNNALLSKFILYQSILYAIIGFTLAFMLLLGMKALMSGGRMQINYSAGLITFLICVTLLISVVGSFFAIIKITRLEPVQIFRM